MRRDHRPTWLARAQKSHSDGWARRFLLPQFEAAGPGCRFAYPWNIEVVGRGISLGAHVDLFAARGVHTRLCTWAPPERPAHITIGTRVLISPGLTINAAVGVTIGDDTMIASGVYISDSDWHGLYDRAHEPETAAPVLLEENVWLGLRTIVGKGVTIGRNTVVGAGSVVVSSLPANVVAAGNPAKIVKELDPDRPIITRAALFEDPAALAAADDALMRLALKDNSTLHWLRSALWPSRED